MNPITWLTLALLGSLGFLTAALVVGHWLDYVQSHRVADRANWRQMRHLGSTRATKALTDLGQLVLEPCGQCGHERVAHEAGMGYCGAIVEEVGVEAHNPPSPWKDPSSIESACWCGRFIPPVRYMRRIP